MRALKTFERTQRRSNHAGMSEIQLDNFVARSSSRVSYVDRNSHGSVGLYVRSIHARIAVCKRRIAQTVAERIQRLSIEVAIGPLGHRVILEGRKLID